MADNKQEYLVVNPEGGAARTTTDPGNATVVGGSSAATPFDWTPWAYTAGGGALGYMLSKWLMGDDEDEKGNKKDKGILKSLIPWLSAAAGAYGGHLLSGAGLTDKGHKGEYAFRKNEDGTIQAPSSRPWSGKIPRKTGNGLLYASALPAGRAAFSAAANRPGRLLDKINSAQAERDAIMAGNRSVRSLNAKDAARVGVLDENIKKFTKQLDGSNRRAGSLYGKTVNFFGKQAPGKWGKLLNTKGSLLTSLALALSGGAGKWLGHSMNARRKGIDRAMELAGTNYEE